MDLRNFISATVLDINDAIMDIQGEDGGVYELAPATQRSAHGGHDFGRVHFDVAVVAGQEQSQTIRGKAGVGIVKVVSIEGNAEMGSSSVNEKSSRISFDLVLALHGDRKHSKRSLSSGQADTELGA